MATGYRTKFLDFDARHEPKTDRYCARCQKDIKPGSAAREIHIVDGGGMVLHPQDEKLYPSGDPADLGIHLIGPECAKTFGLEWSRPAA